MRKLSSFILPAALSAALGLGVLSPALAGDDTATAEHAGKTIVTTAVEAGSFNTLVAAVKAAGLVDTLNGDVPFTVFAPTDAAFAALPEGTVATLLKPENRDQLRAVLTFHVIPGRVDAAHVTKMSGATTVQGQFVDFKTSDAGVMVNGSKVVKADIACSNGIIHVIDKVILPESKNLAEVASGAGSFGTLVAAVKAAGLLETIAGPGPYTVFAPTDAAFAKLPEGTVADLLKPENKATLVKILTHHVVPGRVYSNGVPVGKAVKTAAGTELAFSANDHGIFAAGAKIIATDIDASNGVIHVIDSVIVPGASTSAAPSSDCGSKKDCGSKPSCGSDSVGQ